MIDVVIHIHYASLYVYIIRCEKSHNRCNNNTQFSYYITIFNHSFVLFIFLILIASILEKSYRLYGIVIFNLSSKKHEKNSTFTSILSYYNTYITTGDNYTYLPIPSFSHTRSSNSFIYISSQSSPRNNSRRSRVKRVSRM